MRNAYDVLKERGFIAQCTHEDELRELMGKEKLSFYIGYDPTADSLTAGHFLTLMALSHLQKAGHRPITLMGTGTGMVGDPSERSDMRRVMSREEVMHNIECFKKQVSRFIDYSDDKAVMEENDWLLNLQYIPFIREYGVHFSVNKMLAKDTYKSRIDDGLTFFEFNYVIMQSYDFLELYRRYGCRVQLGGDDQWANIIAGVELVRKVEREQVFGLTFNLLTAPDGAKMGKSLGNAVWINAEKTSPYDFYQYWRNTSDALVARNLKLLTFLEMDEINEMATWRGAELNRAKDILAYEVTKIVHGEDEAEKAQSAAKALFAGGGDLENMPTTDISRAEVAVGMNVITFLEKLALIPSRGEGRRLIHQGGIKINDAKITSHEHTIDEADFPDGFALVQKGKKIFERARLV
ncbi:MAG: tyrosine--tRNA ligase [Defluviitaleaceae bacterium]|nr:tyrosine--tRNA ligase [Defluviitaleaceae bacterium]